MNRKPFSSLTNLRNKSETSIFDVNIISGMFVYSRREILEIAGKHVLQESDSERLLHVLRLILLLEQNKQISDNLVLKGGAAINLFYLNCDRTDFDLNFDFNGTFPKEELKSRRIQFECDFCELLEQNGFRLFQEEKGYATSNWSFAFNSVLGDEAVVNIDVNYIFRIPVYPVKYMKCLTLDGYGGGELKVQDINEIAASKVAAALNRKKPSDLFDIWRLLDVGLVSLHTMKIPFLIYGIIGQGNLLNLKPEIIEYNRGEVRRQYGEILASTDDDVTVPFADELLSFVRNVASVLLDFSASEHEFVRSVYYDHQLKPDLITGDTEISEKIVNNPMLKWRVILFKRIYQNENIGE